jgi:two-component system sensor histidine kinase PilS (NtrC family)
MREPFPSTPGIIVSRLLIAVVVVLTALVGRTGVDRAAIVWLAVASGALTGGFAFWHRTGSAPRLLLHVQFALDVALITLLAHFSGGLASPFKLLYFLPVIASSARLGARSGTGISGAAVAGYLILAFVSPSGLAYLAETGATAEVTTLIVSLLLVATLVGQLARAEREGEREIERLASELDTTSIRMSNILESISSGLVLVDAGGEVVHVNRAGEAILGVSEAAARGRDYRVVFAEVPAFCERIAAALEAGRPESRAEFFVRRRRGGSIPVGLSTSILKDEAGTDRGVIAIFRDLTEAREMEERLRQEDRLAALGEFAAGVAHEIRNPLHVIKGSVDMLRESLRPEGDDRKLLDLVARESDRLSGFIRDVLQYGRMGSSEREAEPLGPLLEDVVLLARNHPSFGESVELIVEAPGECEAVVNADEMKRALLNLVINGIESVDGRGRVRVSLVPKSEFGARGLEMGADHELAVVVEDTGHGIPHDMRDLIFQPFRTSKKGGTGLGLAIVDRIVRSHGGRITVASEPGRGSRFVVYLPG